MNRKLAIFQTPKGLRNTGTLILGLLLCCAALSPVLGFGATYQVKQDGSGDFTTIQTAMDTVVDGDVIVTHPGTYYENIHFEGKNITLRSLDPEDEDVVASTIIDGSQNGSVVTFSGTENESCLLSGFTITNGKAKSEFPNGGGISSGEYLRSTHARISNCTISGNSAADSGGGLYRCDGPISNCTITGNLAGCFGGGLSWCRGTITNSTISGNIADSAGGGGLAYCNGAIDNCEISGNSAAADNARGGGVLGCNGTITNCEITGNSANRGGGLEGCDATITCCAIDGNSAKKDGGGLLWYYGTISHCTISGNSAGRDGGGLFRCIGAISNTTITGNSACDGGGLYDFYGTISNCTISGNFADAGGGGLAYCYHTIDSCAINDNKAEYGGGLLRCDGTITNCAITGNSTVRNGGGLHSCGIPMARYRISNCVVSGNSAGQGGGGLSGCIGMISNTTITGNSAGDGGGLHRCSGTIISCIVWGNQAALQGGQFHSCESAIAEYSCVQDWSGGGEGNTSDHPLFVSGRLGDYYLSCREAGQGADSPCIDAGNGTAESLSLDKLTTRTDGVSDAGIVDMGYHYPPSLDQNTRIECLLNTSEFRSSDTLVGFIEAQNTGPEVAVDVYVAFVLPDGAVISLTGEGPTYGIHPWVSDALLPSGFDFGPYEVIRVTVPRCPGSYFFAAALTHAGRFELLGEMSLFPFTITE